MDMPTISLLLRNVLSHSETEIGLEAYDEQAVSGECSSGNEQQQEPEH